MGIYVTRYPVKAKSMSVTANGYTYKIEAEATISIHDGALTSSPLVLLCSSEPLEVSESFCDLSLVSLRDCELRCLRVCTGNVEMRLSKVRSLAALPVTRV